MDKIEERRIGIFEYDWSMYGFIKDFVIKLAEAGYSVDIFFKDLNIGLNFADASQFGSYSNIRYYYFTTRTSLNQRLIRKFKKLLSILTMGLSKNFKARPENIIDNKILRKTKKIINESQYLCFIGIEKKGLIWAGILSQIYKCPLIYYSLELYIEDHPYITEYFHLRDAEKRNHQLSFATIIQDGPRANALLKSNGVEQTNVIYFPVSAKGNLVKEKSKFLHKKFNIDDYKKILLYFGSIFETRFITQIVKMAKDLDDDTILVLHGYGSSGYIEYLQSIADKAKVIFSLDLVPEEDIVKIISSSDIGIALYSTTNANDRLIAHSSMKLAYFAQCGIPVIAFDTESSIELMNSYRWGELINTVDEIPQKVRQILGDYDSYKQQAFSAYNHCYDLEITFAKFLLQFEEIIKMM